MTLLEHIRNYLQLYLFILSWVILGQFTSSVVAGIWAVVSFLLILKSRNLSQIIIAFVAVLILSDSRLPMMQFASTAKIGFILSLAAYVLVGGVKSQYKNEIFRFFLPFAVFAILATVWASDYFVSIQKSVSYAILLFALPSAFLKAREENTALLSDIISFITIVLGIGLILFLLIPDSVLLVGRYRGLLGNPNGLGILLTATGPLFFLSLRSAKADQLNKTGRYIFFLVFVLSLVLSGSRTSLFAVLLFIGFYLMRNLPQALTFTMFIAVSVSYDTILTSLPQLSTFLGIQDYLRIETLNEGSGRFVAWNFAINNIESVFFLGGGYGYTELIFNKFFWELSSIGHQGNAHNSYLTIWLDTGLIGLSLFIIGMIRTSLTAFSKSRYALPIIYSMLFSANFESWLAASLNPFTSLFLILLTILLVQPNPEGVESPENTPEITS